MGKRDSFMNFKNFLTHSNIKKKKVIFKGAKKLLGIFTYFLSFNLFNNHGKKISSTNYSPGNTS